nr:4'-phosphopantetheinyl transferase superfamily protein [Chromobacterium sp. ASV5]
MNEKEYWREALRRGESPPGAEDVAWWRLDIEHPSLPEEAGWAYLSGEEIARGERYRQARSRRQFARTRAALRLLLAGLEACPPRALAFETGESGKPFLADSPWHFNVSHSGRYALLAFSRRGPLGVDVEEMRPAADLPALCELAFREDERAACGQGGDLAAFYRQWSVKEAVLKAWGAGIGEGLQAFSALPGEGAEWRLIARELAWWRPCRAWRLDAAPGYAAALACCV